MNGGLHFKPGVRVGKMAPQLWAPIRIYEWLCEQLGVPATVTSISEGTHGRASLHYIGHAVDLRSKHLTPGQKKWVLQEMRARLTEDYDVILEAEGKANEHIHAEFQPKTPGG